MVTYRSSDGRTCTLGKIIGGGGEGRIYEVVARPGEVAKVWKRPDPRKRQEARAFELRGEKLKVLLRNRPALPPELKPVVGLAWPTADLYDDAGTPAGFLMRRARLGQFRELVNYSVLETRQHIRKVDGAPLNRTDLLTMSRNLALLFDHLHRHGYVIGDVNHTNVLADPDGRLYLTDIDSIQVKDPSTGKVYRCMVGKDEFTPPRLVGRRLSEVDRTVDDDLFGLAALVFELLMEGNHPYDPVDRSAPGGHIRVENIRKSHSPFAGLDTAQARGWLELSAIPDARLKKTEQERFLKKVGRRATADFPSLLVDRAKLWVQLEPGLRALSVRAFGNGPGARPGAREWARALAAAGARQPDTAPAVRPPFKGLGIPTRTVNRPNGGSTGPLGRPAPVPKRGNSGVASPAFRPARAAVGRRTGTGAMGRGSLKGNSAVSGGNAYPHTGTTVATSTPSSSTSSGLQDILSQLVSWTILFGLTVSILGMSYMCYLDLFDPGSSPGPDRGRNVGPCEELQVGAVLGKCDFTARDLRGLDLTGVELQHSDLGRANLEGTIFDYADLSNTVLSGANLKGASLQRASLAGARVEGADFSGVDLYSTDLSGIESFDYAVLKSAVFPYEADLSGVSFKGANLSESFLNKANLVKADFTGARLYRSDFSEADLIKATFREASMQGVYFSGVEMRGAELTEADLRDAGFHWADVSKSDFTRSDLTNASFAYARVQGADFSEADLTGAYFGNSSGASKAKFENTVCSDGVRSDDCHKEGRLLGIGR